MATFPISGDYLLNVASPFSLLDEGNGGELQVRVWDANGYEELFPTNFSFTPLLNQTSPVSIREWGASGYQELFPTIFTLTPLVNQTSPVSVRSYTATSRLAMNLSGSATCNWPTLPTTGQIWPLDNYFYDYAPTPPPSSPASQDFSDYLYDLN